MLTIAAYRRTRSPSRLVWSEGRRPLGAALHSSDEPGELSQWLCHDDSTINIVRVLLLLLLLLLLLCLVARNRRHFSWLQWLGSSWTVDGHAGYFRKALPEERRQSSDRSLLTQLKARFPLPVLTVRVNGPSWRVTGFHYPSTRVVESDWNCNISAFVANVQVHTRGLCNNT